MTGAPIPHGATSVLASEFAEVDGKFVTIRADARAGRNILRRGSDIVQDQVVLARGNLLSPAHLGLLAAAGLNKVLCYPLPKVAVAATGSELVWPGEPVTPGKIAASNMVIAAAELQALGVKASTVLLRDNLDQLQKKFRGLVRQVDVLITCGGVLDGDKDLTMRAMEQIGMEKIFHRVRIGPGKGACMGRIGNTVVFNLPGGPPSNHVALLLLALPGVRRLMGFKNFLPPKRKVFVTEELTGQEDWTQFMYSSAKYDNGLLFTVPLRSMGKLIAYRAETAMVNIARQTMRHQDEARSLLRSLYATEADVQPDYEGKRIIVRLHQPANQCSAITIKDLCRELNETNTKYPGTDLRLFYELVS